MAIENADLHDLDEEGTSKNRRVMWTAEDGQEGCWGPDALTGAAE